MASVFERDTSTIGTVAGIVVFSIALVGTAFFGWEWGASSQPVAFVVGGLAAIAAVWLSFQKLRG